MAGFFKGGRQAKSQRNGFGLDNPAGVGIVFKSGPDEALFVKALADNGPAAVYGKIQVNDCLLKVDGEDVYRQPIEKVIKYILGEQDSKITLTFQRFSGDKISKYTAELKRGKTAKIAKAVEQEEEEDVAVEGRGSSQNAAAQQNSLLAAEASAMKAEALEEKQLAQQQRVSERLARMKEMQEIIAMSYTGSSHIEDAAGAYEGDMKNGKKHGKGVMKFRNGDIYTGGCSRDMPDPGLSCVKAHALYLTL